MTGPSLRIVCRRGFTLAELLIAIVIFTVVIAMVYGAYNATFKVIANADSNSRYAERARVTLERIAEDLQSLYLGSTGMLIGETASFGEFRGDTLSFTSRAHLIFNNNEPLRGYATISYSIEEDPESGLLLLYRADVPVLPGAEVDETKGFLLCDGLREVIFTYIDREGNESDSWSSQGRSREGDGVVLPAMVRVKIGFTGSEEEESVINYSIAVALAEGGEN